MTILKRFKNLIYGTKDSFKRFPVTLVTSSFLALFLIYTNEISIGNYQVLDRLHRMALVIALGIPLSLCIKFISEKYLKGKIIFEYLLYFLGLIGLILYYYNYMKDYSMVSVTRYIGLSLFLYLSFLFIPYVNKKENYEFYINKTFFYFALTYLYSLVLFIGISAIIGTINSLFEANISSEFYYYSFLIIGLIFAPAMFLSKIPLEDEDLSLYACSKSLKVLLLYIVLPLISIYSLILYVYFGKIIVTQIWPRGLVSHLVLWYSVLSIIVLFLITPIVEENKWAKIFRKYFPIFIIPILIMMFVSMGLRINQYGITEPRYFGLVLGLWVLAMMIYFILKKKSWNVIIPLSLAIVAFLAVIGPLSGYSLSKYSQNTRLEDILVRNDMVEGRSLVKNPNIASEDKIEISNILKYFEDNHSLQDVNYLDSDFSLSKMNEVFGFARVEDDEFDKVFYLNMERRNTSIDIEDYHYYIHSIMDGDIRIEDKKIEVKTTGDYRLIIEKDGKPIYQKDLKEYVASIVRENLEEEVGKELLNMEDATFIDGNENIEIKIIFFDIGGSISPEDEVKLDYLNPHIMIKILE